MDKENVPPVTNLEDALTLIKHLQAENEKLTNQLKSKLKRAASEEEEQDEDSLSSRRKFARHEYQKLKQTERASLIAACRNSCLRGCDEKDKVAREKNFNEFACDLFCFGVKSQVSNRMNVLLDRPVIGQILENRVKESLKEQDEGTMKKLDGFCSRKLANMGLERANAFSKRTERVLSIGSAKCELKSYQSSKRKEAKGRKLVASTYNLPEVYTLPEQHVSKEHADLNLKDFLKSLVHLIYTCPQLRKHMHWFYDVQRGCPKVNHLKIGIFFYGFPLFKFPKRNGTVLCIQILNLIGLIQIPKYTWVKFFIVDSETGTCVWVLLEITDDEVLDLATECFEVVFQDIYGEMTVPNSNEPLSGQTIKISCDFHVKPDGKGLLNFNGTLSANMMYPSPYYKIGKDSLMNLSINTRSTATTIQQRRSDFEAIATFRDTQLSLFANERELILKDKHKSDEQKDKAITNKYKSLVQDKICAKAAALKSCCIHNRPLFMAAQNLFTWI